MRTSLTSPATALGNILTHGHTALGHPRRLPARQGARTEGGAVQSTDYSPGTTLQKRDRLAGAICSTFYGRTGCRKPTWWKDLSHKISNQQTCPGQHNYRRLTPSLSLPKKPHSGLCHRPFFSARCVWGGHELGCRGRGGWFQSAPRRTLQHPRTSSAQGRLAASTASRDRCATRGVGLVRVPKGGPLSQPSSSRKRFFRRVASIAGFTDDRPG